MRYFVVGDTGGHLKQLKAGLSAVGVDVERYSIPKDMTIIHMGDLIHKGPHSLTALEFVQAMQESNPGRWIQLLGNHELMHLEDAARFWNCSNCGVEVDETIRSMRANGKLWTAFSLKGLIPANLTLSARNSWTPQNSDWLFTHGGVSRDWIEEMQSGVTDVDLLAAALNGRNVFTLDYAGERMGWPGVLASPIWASAPTEVFPTWLDSGMPFNQIAGHTYAFDWERECWFGSKKRLKQFVGCTKLNPQLRTSITKIGDSVLVGVDPGFEKQEPSIAEQPVIFIGSIAD